MTARNLKALDDGQECVPRGKALMAAHIRFSGR
jgi:hypothetical protein